MCLVAHLLGRAWYRYGMERKFWYKIWKMPEWNGRFQEWNGRQSSIFPSYQFHARFRALYLQKNIYRYGCRVIANNIVAEVFNFHIYEGSMTTDCNKLTANKLTANKLTASNADWPKRAFLKIFYYPQSHLAQTLI